MLNILIGFLVLGFLMLTADLFLACLGVTGVIKKGPSDPPYSTIVPILLVGGVGITFAAVAGIFVYLAYHPTP